MSRRSSLAKQLENARKFPDSYGKGTIAYLEAELARLPAEAAAKLRNLHTLAQLEARKVQLLQYSQGELGATLGLPLTEPCVQLADRHLRHEFRKMVLGEKPRADALMCRRCGNDACVTRAHLFWGTPRDRARDAKLRKKPLSKKLEALDRRIRRLHERRKKPRAKTQTGSSDGAIGAANPAAESGS